MGCLGSYCHLFVHLEKECPLWRADWPSTCYIDQSVLKPMELYLPLAVPRLKVCASSQAKNG